jgi:hypothetical protein
MLNALKIHGDTERRADLILTTVSSSDADAGSIDYMVHPMLP